MYECPCKTIESLDLMKRTILDKNQLMTCYLIFNFRPTFFSYFWKITADSVFHNVKKQVGQKWPFPVVKGLRSAANFIVFFLKFILTIIFEIKILEKNFLIPKKSHLRRLVFNNQHTLVVTLFCNQLGAFCYFNDTKRGKLVSHMI